MVSKPALITIGAIVSSGVLGVGVAVSSVILHIVIAATLLILLCLTLLALGKRQKSQG